MDVLECAVHLKRHRVEGIISSWWKLGSCNTSDGPVAHGLIPPKKDKSLTMHCIALLGRSWYEIYILLDPMTFLDALECVIHSGGGSYLIRTNSTLNPKPLVWELSFPHGNHSNFKQLTQTITKGPVPKLGQRLDIALHYIACRRSWQEVEKERERERERKR